MADNRILVLFGHPALRKSRVNARLVEAAAAVPGVRVRDLYELYPDFMIDVPAEQAMLHQHDLIVFQHPFYWYSVPAIFKEWSDLVLEYGYAYGPGGVELRGKSWLSAITTGGLEDSYAREGANRFTIPELLAPIERTATLCGMRFLKPHVTYGALGLDSAHGIPLAADAYRRRLEHLRHADLQQEPTHAR